MTIGTVIHGFSDMAGHGPGVNPILSAMPGPDQDQDRPERQHRLLSRDQAPAPLTAVICSARP